MFAKRLFTISSLFFCLTAISHAEAKIKISGNGHWAPEGPATYSEDGTVSTSRIEWIPDSDYGVDLDNPDTGESAGDGRGTRGGSHISQSCQEIRGLILKKGAEKVAAWLYRFSTSRLGNVTTALGVPYVFNRLERENIVASIDEAIRIKELEISDAEKNDPSNTARQRELLRTQVGLERLREKARNGEIGELFTEDLGSIEFDMFIAAVSEFTDQFATRGVAMTLENTKLNSQAVRDAIAKTVQSATNNATTKGCASKDGKQKSASQPLTNSGDTAQGVNNSFALCDPLQANLDTGESMKFDLQEACSFGLEKPHEAIFTKFHVLTWADIRKMSDQERSFLYSHFEPTLIGYTQAALLMQPLDNDFLPDESPAFSNAGAPTVNGDTLTYQADSASTENLQLGEDKVLVEAFTAEGKRAVIPVDLSIEGHRPVCGDIRKQLKNFYDNSRIEVMNTDGIFGGVGGTTNLDQTIVAERGSQISLNNSCFDSDFDLQQELLTISGSLRPQVNHEEDRKVRIAMPANQLGSAGDIAVQAKDSNGLSSEPVTIPVVVKDVPYVCQTTKGRLVLHVTPGVEQRVNVPCTLKNDVRPLVPVKSQSGVFEDRNGTFSTSISQTTGAVSLDVNVNPGVIGTFTRTVTLFNGALKTVLPVDVVVDDPTQGGAEGTGGTTSGSGSSTSGGKYNPPADTPGPTAPAPGGGKAAGDGTLSPSPSGTKKPAKTDG